MKFENKLNETYSSVPEKNCDRPLQARSLGEMPSLKTVLGLLTTAIPYTFTSLIVKALASTSSNHLTVEILLLNEAHLTTIVKLPSYSLLKDVR